MKNIFKLTQKQLSSSLTPFPHSFNHRGTKNKLGFISLNKAFVRLTIVWLILMMGASVLGWRLHKLQIVRGDELRKAAQQRQSSDFHIYVPRRSIVDAYNNVIATDKVVYSLYVHPSMLPKESFSTIAKNLAEVFPDKNEKAILQKLNSQATGLLIEKNVSEEQAARLRKLRTKNQWDGIDLEYRYGRFYPQHKLVADIVGYVDTDHRGQAGIEHSLEDFLERDVNSLAIKSMLQVKQNGNGEIIPAQLPEGIVELDDLKLQLTIDLRVQRAVQDALDKQVAKFKAKRGTAIVMDVHTGEILSLVCSPTYDPNKYFRFPVSSYKNWAVADSYEPGSTFKPLNVAIALDAGVINANTVVNDTGLVVVDVWPISNAMKTGNGIINVTQVLEKSSNVGMVHLMKRMDKNAYYDHLKKLGLGEQMNIDLPFEATGYIKTREVFTEKDIEPAVSSFGQGLSLTPLKLVQLHAAIANGGKLVTPHVVSGLVNAQGELVQPSSQASIPSEQVFTPKSAQTVLNMMESVVANGTGRIAQIEGYPIGGKTGTAQKHSDRGGYLANAKITSFVSILPADKPRYVILVAVDEPKGGNTYGSTVAAPVAKEIMKSVINLKGIPPSK